VSCGARARIPAPVAAILATEGPSFSPDRRHWMDSIEVVGEEKGSKTKQCVMTHTDPADLRGCGEH
jgi:hypothetical protein